MRTYGQYCPIARASEVLAERWTPIVMRNILVGCRTYTEIGAGAPGLSHSLLTQRLRLLERAGLIETGPKPHGHGMIYRPTEAGRDLWGVLAALGAWGDRWLDVRDEHTSPRVVLWAWSTVYLARERLPDQRVVVRFEFADQPVKTRRLWMLFERSEAELCNKAPGVEDLVVATDAPTLVRWHRGQLRWSDALRSGAITVTGPRNLARSLPTWNTRGVTAGLMEGRLRPSR